MVEGTPCYLQLLGHSRLANAWLVGRNHDGAATGEGIVERRAELLKFLLAANECLACAFGGVGRGRRIRPVRSQPVSTTLLRAEMLPIAARESRLEGTTDSAYTEAIGQHMLRASTQM